jgi:hypothetical protein
MPISEEQKQMQENFHFLLTYAQRLTAAPAAVDMTYKDRGENQRIIW